MDSASVRRELAFLLAAYLHKHLTAELAKAADLVNRETADGSTVARRTEELKTLLLQEFPGADQFVEFNLFEEWVIRRELNVRYQDSTFLQYGRTYLARLLDFRDGTAKSRTHLRDRIRFMLRDGRFRGQQFTFRIFFHAENAMLDLIRERLLAHPEIPFEPAWSLAKEQSEFWGECGYDYYDDLLSVALQEVRAQKEDAEERANRVERELKIASEIQTSILPRQFL